MYQITFKFNEKDIINKMDKKFQAVKRCLQKGSPIDIGNNFVLNKLVKSYINNNPEVINE